MARLAQDAEALRNQLNEMQEKMTACYASMDRIRSDRTKQIDVLKQEIQMLNQEKIQFRAEVVDLSTRKTDLESRLDGLLKQKSHIEFSISFLTQRDPSLPEVKVEIPEDIQPAMRRFRAQISSVEQEIKTEQKRLEVLTESIKQAQDKISRNDLEVENVRSELDGLASDTSCSKRIKELLEEQKGLIDFCCAIEEKLSQVLRKSRILRLDLYKHV